MSGHSKWATIKRKKGAADSRRGIVFTKYANAIALAAKDGADPEINFKLKLAVDRARGVNLPSSNIAKAIARGSGRTNEIQLEEVRYEGYGPAGIAVLVECATDNRNRTAAEVRSVFNKYGGNLAAPGAVAYQFQPKGIIQIEDSDEDKVSLAAIDAGAADVESEDGVVTIYTDPKELAKVRAKLADQKLNIVSAELSQVATTNVSIADKATAQLVINFIDGLETLESVSAVYTNLDIPQNLLSEIV